MPFATPSKDALSVNYAVGSNSILATPASCDFHLLPFGPPQDFNPRCRYELQLPLQRLLSFQPRLL